jgi:hypothetical protein
MSLKRLKGVDQRVKETFISQKMPLPFEEGGMSKAEGEGYYTRHTNEGCAIRRAEE